MMLKNLIIIFLITIVGSCTNEKTSRDVKAMENKDSKGGNRVYTCPMHPEIIREAPGQCPICGMDLVEKKSEGSSVSDNTINFLLKPTDSYVLIRVKTISPQLKELPTEINANGKITYDTREVSVVSARVDGRIEKLYIKYRFQPVEKGQKLLDIYSKDLVTEQENYIYLLKGDAENKALINTAENRLLLLGLTAGQVNELRKTKKPIQYVTIYSPYTGHLHPLTNPSQNSEMSGMNKAGSAELTIKEGMYIQKGQGIFDIYSTKAVWAVLSVYVDKINEVKVGQKVKIKIDDKTYLDENYRVDFIEPEIKGEENTVSIRVYMSNSTNAIKIGSNVNAVIDTGKKNGMFIPTEAIVYLGNNAVVFIKSGKLFMARKVEIGFKTGNWVEVISGLTERDTVAQNAQLLIDSESFIKIENN